MSSQPPHKRFECSLCSYTTNKKYNLERHTATVHIHGRNITTDNVNITTDKVNVSADKVNIATDKVNITTDKVNIAENSDSALTCSHCYKTFTRKYGLKLHLESGKCTKKQHPHECELCKKTLSCKESLSRHRKTCDGIRKDIVKVADPQPSGSGVVNASVINGDVNMGVQNKTEIQNQTNNTNNILIFPMTYEASQNFDFITDHINMDKLEQFIKQQRPCIGFNQFVNEVLDHPQNRNVQKTNMKDRYSKVLVGEDKWELALDGDVYPTLTHHMTTAALGKMEQHKMDIPRSIKQKSKEFIKFIDYINTTDEGAIYNDTVERIKLLLVNLCNSIK